MVQTAPPGARVATLHEMGREFLEAVGEKPNFGDADVFDKMAVAVVQYAHLLQGEFATLVIDEAQDFEGQWINALVSLATEQTRVVVLEDPAQRLYNRSATELTGWVVLNSPVNYRSPRAVVDKINELGLTDTPIEWGGAVVGKEPRSYEYEPGGVLAATEQAVRDLLEEGFSPAQIVVLSIRGVGSSELFALDPSTSVAGHRFKRSIGFDEEGNPTYTDGQILLETVYRFKGQAADAVVLVGVPRDIDSDTERNKVFGGVTLGRLALRVIQLPWHPLNVGRSDQPSR
jgi:hypothetical protein